MRILGIFLLLAASLAQAQPRFSLPLRCEPGRDCWIANHMDLDPGPGARDYACGRMTYDGHNGTDFAIRDLRSMAEGVAVLAAADGVVRAMRDGEADRSVRETGVEALQGRDCGNSVRIEHPGGWSSLYCHMRRGSVSVKPNQKVDAGTPIGLVGLSGRTEYPHLHFTVLHERRAIDPFRGLDAPPGCGLGPAPLWEPRTLAAIGYAPGALYNFGVAAEPPDAARARAGAYRDTGLAASAPLFALWAEAFGARAGDAIAFELLAPDGAVLVSQRLELPRVQARVFRWVGKKAPPGGWPVGRYHGKIAYTGSENPPRVLSTAEIVFEVR